MIDWIVAGFLVVGFLAMLALFRLADKSKDVVAISRRCLGTVRDSTLSDQSKAAILQKDAKTLGRLSFAIIFGGAAAAGLPIGLVVLGDWVGWVSLESALRITVSPAFLLISGLLATLIVYWRFATVRRTAETAAYSPIDRLLHRVAFHTRAAQTSVADMEDIVFSKQLAECEVERPVFITGLPRAGTTLLLECCVGAGEFASHCYRDMPFVLVPCLWDRFSAAFRRKGESRPRAHGDGMLIDFDSPEAFEEVLWKTFWPKHYRPDRVVPWQADEGHAEFDSFFRGHLRKVLYLRQRDGGNMMRYVSKGNLNIARVSLLRRLFADAIILVPFRHPLQQAASLLRQHRNFLRIHREDPFASEYMRAIGHFDFGENLRPIDFDGWFDRRESRDPESLAFWLEYWAAAYGYMLDEHVDSIQLFEYDALCENPESQLRRLAELVGCGDRNALYSAAKNMHRPREHDVEVSAVSDSILREAERVYDRLQEAALRNEEDDTACSLACVGGRGSEA